MRHCHLEAQRKAKAHVTVRAQIPPLRMRETTKRTHCTPQCNMRAFHLVCTLTVISTGEYNCVSSAQPLICPVTWGSGFQLYIRATLCSLQASVTAWFRPRGLGPWAAGGIWCCSSGWGIFDMMERMDKGYNELILKVIEVLISLPVWAMFAKNPGDIFI